MYARFFTRALIDVGLAPPELEREPFHRLFTQGMIRMDGTKMSKSKGNLISPERYYETVGADGLRLLHLFLGPPADNVDWTPQTDEVADGCGRFLARLWRLANAAPPMRTGAESAADASVRRAIHRTIERVTADLDRWSYNTAVAHCMELVNELQRYQRGAGGPHREVMESAVDSLLLLMAPMTPHVTAELWERRHGPVVPSVHLQPWPSFDPALAAAETVTLVVQVNGKVRDRLDVDPSIGEEEARSLALSSPRVIESLGGAVPSRVIVRPPRLVNIVV
jgi:leucyl-tRNA synthetase